VKPTGKTTLDSLGFRKGPAFGYWFDFGDDWSHPINVAAIEEVVPSGKYPKVTKRVGRVRSG
jgi:pRiA4b ORF-3-like protein